MTKKSKRKNLDAKTPGKLGKKAPGVPKGGNPIDHGKKMKLGMRK